MSFRYSVLAVLLVFSVRGMAASAAEKILDSYIIAKAETHQTPFTDADLSTKPYTIHVVSYINEKDAASHVEEVKLQEKEVFYVPAFVRGQIWFKVCVGRFENKKDADEYRKKFMKRMDEPLSTVISLLDRPTDRRMPASVATKEKTEVPIDKETGVATTDTLPAVAPTPKTAVPMPVTTTPEVKMTETPTTPMLGSAVKNYFYTLQVGAYPTVELAKTKINELEIKGQDIFYQEADVSGKKWYRVLIGRFGTKREADGYQDSLKEQGKISEALVRKVKTE